MTTNEKIEEKNAEPSGDQVELKELRHRAIDEGKAFGVTRLKGEYRMKPKPGAVPAFYAKSSFSSSKNPCYNVSDCIPMRPLKKKVTPTEKQIRARKNNAVTAKLKSKRMRVAIQLIELREKYSGGLHFLDTVTSGLCETDQVIEIGIVDLDGSVLLEQRFKPTVDIDPAASCVHGMYESMLRNEPLWPEHVEQIKKTVKRKLILIFNKWFDLRMLRSSSIAFDLDTDWIREIKSVCMMNVCAKAYGPTNRYGSISLSDSMDEAGVEFKGKAHSAVADALATRDIFHALTSEYEALQTKQIEFKSNK